MPAAKSPLSLARAAFALLVLWACYEFAHVETALAHGNLNASLTIVIAAVIAVSAAPRVLAAPALRSIIRTITSWKIRRRDDVQA